MSDKDDLIFIEHILDNINKIKSFSKNMTKDELFKDEERQYAIVRAIEIIGEAAKNISKDLTKKYPNIEWKEIIGTRDKIIHHYFGVDLEIVWNIIEKDIPDLKQKILKVKEDLEEHEKGRQEAKKKSKKSENAI